MKQLCSLTLALFTIAGALSNAQTLHVKLVNGISAKPISNAYVNVWVGDQRKEALPISVDINGIATLSLTSNVSDVHVQAESIRWPTFLYAPEIRVQRIVGWHKQTNPHWPSHRKCPEKRRFQRLRILQSSNYPADMRDFHLRTTVSRSHHGTFRKTIRALDSPRR